MNSESLTVIKFAACVVMGFSGVVMLHALIPPIALTAIVILSGAMLGLIGFNKGEIAPYALVALAMLVALVLGVK